MSEFKQLEVWGYQMQIKKFEAADMKDALFKIKQEFGSNAVILAVRKLENIKKNIKWGKASGVEVTAATDAENFRKGSVTGQTDFSAYGDNPKNTFRSRNRDEKYRVMEVFKKGKRVFRHEHDKWAESSPEIKMNNKEAKELYVSYQQMLHNDVDREIARRVIRDAVQFGLSDPGLYKIGFKSCLIQILQENGVYARRLKIDKNSKKIVIAVGPAGVGKTTTIAKLAASAKNGFRKKNVAIITTDDNRIGALEQLKVYSRIMEVPLRSALSSKEIRKHFVEFNDMDLIFVDTPGVCGNCEDRINHIQNLFSNEKEVEYHLVLSASTNDKTICEIVKQFSTLKVHRIVFTKLDECITYGSMLNQLYRFKIPVSYFTNGQKVPEDIEAASVEKLIDLVLNDETRAGILAAPPEILAENIVRFENILNGNNEEYGSLDLRQDVYPVVSSPNSNAKHKASGGYGR